MSNELTLEATSRSALGKGASRRLRRLEGMVPAIVYGGEQEPKNVSIEFRLLDKALQSEAFYSQIVTLVVDGASEQVVLKDLQRHPAKNTAIHADFLRVVAGKALQKSVPLHFVGEEQCVGVKRDGGSIGHLMSEVEIRCLPKNLPEFIEVDMTDVEVGQIVHLSDLKLPNDGIELVQLALGADHDLPVVAVNAPKGGAAASDEEATEEGIDGEG